MSDGYAEVAQEFCCLPWCGKTGKIDLHHIVPRSQGGSNTAHNLLPVCHPCHMRHHSEGDYRLTVSSQDMIDGKREVFVQRADGHEGWCVFADEARQDDSPEVMDESDGEFLQECEASLIHFNTQANARTYYASQTVRAVLEVFERKYPPREARRRVTEWASELTDDSGAHRPIAPSTLSKMLLTADLPEVASVLELSLAERYRFKRALDTRAASFEDTMEDLLLLSREDFDAKYLGKTPSIEKPRCTCPTCGALHAKKGDDK